MRGRVIGSSPVQLKAGSCRFEPCPRSSLPGVAQRQSRPLLTVTMGVQIRPARTITARASLHNSSSYLGRPVHSLPGRSVCSRSKWWTYVGHGSTGPVGAARRTRATTATGTAPGPACGRGRPALPAVHSGYRGRARRPAPGTPAWSACGTSTRVVSLSAAAQQCIAKSDSLTSPVVGYLPMDTHESDKQNMADYDISRIEYHVVNTQGNSCPVIPSSVGLVVLSIAFRVGYERPATGSQPCRLRIAWRPGCWQARTEG